MSDKDDQFYYGQRQIIVQNETAQPTYQYIPLTLEDYLAPEPDDDFVQGTQHDQEVARLYAILHHHHRYSPFLTVLRKVKLMWKTPDLPQPIPDIVIVPSLHEPETPRRILDIATEGTTPACIIEVTSPRFAQLDLVQKVNIYEQAGVTEYFVVDSEDAEQGNKESSSTQGHPYHIVGYRLVADRYQPISPDNDGRLYSEVNRAWIATASNATASNASALQIIHGQTGKPIEPPADTVLTATKAQSEANVRAQSIADQLGFLQSDLDTF